MAPPDPHEPRTKQHAIEALMALVPEMRNQLSDDKAQALFTDRLVRDVFSEAWKAQFEDNRASFRREVKRIIDEVVAEARLGEDDAQ
jgi:hypothetical protein